MVALTSSLVYLATLVAAGIYLIIRFSRLIITSKLNFYLLLIIIVTIISGINALYECDLRNIVASSTLSPL